MRVMVLLAALLTVSTASAQNARNANQAPDVVFYNAKVITVDSTFSIQQAFAVRGDTYVAVGSNATVRALAGKNTRLVDLRGAAVIPGLSDSHDHLFNSERYMRGIDLAGARSTSEVLRRLRDGMAQFKPGETVFGGLGWRAPLTRTDLDGLSETVPIVALSGRRGEAVMNTAALAKAGVGPGTKDFLGSAMPRDANGGLTGTMPSGRGLDLIDRVVPVPTPSEEEQLILHGQQQRLALGITSIRELSSSPAGVRAFERVRDDGKLQMRVAFGLEVSDRDGPQAFLRNQVVNSGFGDKWLRFSALGETVPTTAEFSREMNHFGWRPAPHLTENDALDRALDAWESADHDQSIKGKRWFVEHVPNVTPKDIKRIAALGLIVSTNMAGYPNDYDAAIKTLGQEQADRQTPVRELLDAGLIVLSGSDYNGPNPPTAATNNNPWIHVYYYTTRKNKDGRVVGPQEKITRQEALRIVTVNNAYATFEEGVKGPIEIGKLADFVVLSADYLTVSDEDILKLRPIATYVGGIKVYGAAAASGGY